MTLGEKLVRARDARGWSQELVGQRLGVSRSAVHLWETDASVPRMPKLRKLAELYECDLGWLLNGNDETAPDQVIRAGFSASPAQRAVPVISYVQAGEWTVIRDDMDMSELDSVVTDTPVSAGAFALIVEGLSMVPDIGPGDKLIVDPDVKPWPGAIVVAQIDDESMATVKRYRDRGIDAEGNRVIELAASNPDYASLWIDARRPGRIVGTVVERRSYPGER